MRVFFGLRVVAGLCALALSTSATAAETLRPGQWETTSIVRDVVMPGGPPGLAAMMKGKPQTFRHCVTAEESAAGAKELFARSNGQCRFTRFDMARGKVDMVMQCTHQSGGGTMIGTTRGNYTPTAYQTDSRMEMSGPRGKMTILSSGVGKWLGPCK